MRLTKNINHDWCFIQKNITFDLLSSEQGTIVDLPHTWNAVDGQDGGNDYHRGTCWYTKYLPSLKLDGNEEAWLEFRGAAMTAEVYVNGHKLMRHEGGYSTFRVNITSALLEENFIAVSVDNSKNRTVYPQKADFTFYGGIYRDVNLIIVPKAHFELGYNGGNGIKVTPEIHGDHAEVLTEAWVKGNATSVDFTVNRETKSAELNEGYAFTKFLIKNVHLWNGLNDPFLYTAQAVLPENGDNVSVAFGCRTFSFSAENGFSLNGQPYPLCGAARHQDRQGVGNAINKAMQYEDMELLLEMGANTVRLAHYQHDQYFYDLCDEKGMIVWAEIPYITEHMPEANANSRSQLTELVVQNYHHPSIVCWGLSNEITATGGVSKDLYENHLYLNQLCKNLDKTRPTTMSHVFMLEQGDDLVTLPDIRSFNLYYGWYVGEPEDNDEWFDSFHKSYPNTVIGLSEYGADGNPEYQSEVPKKGDWTEGYQSIYHEHMLKMWSERPYIWAMHVWNMFDFGADGRDEGGKPGQNQKGLVTFDRKTKKDAFYIYKAYLSKEPFLHICGRRYVDRNEDTTEIKVYSNLSEITLYVDDTIFETKKGNKVFKFIIPITGHHSIVARGKSLEDQIEINRTDVPNTKYFKDGMSPVNWFDKDKITVKEGYFSIFDTMTEIKACDEALAVLSPIQQKAKESYGDVAKNIKMPESITRMMDQMTAEAMLKQLGKLVTPDIIVEVNNALNKIEKPSKQEVFSCN